jgi:hypothetical protein
LPDASAGNISCSAIASFQEPHMTEKTEKPAKPEKIDKADKGEKPEKADKGQKDKPEKAEKKGKGPPADGGATAPAAPKVPTPPKPTLDGAVLDILAKHPAGLTSREVSVIARRGVRLGKPQNFPSVVSGVLHRLKRAEKVVHEGGKFKRK